MNDPSGGLVPYLLSKGGFDPETDSWFELAHRFGISEGKGRTVRRNNALSIWRRFLGSERGLEFKSATINKKGEVVSTRMGRASLPDDIPEGGSLVFVTTTPSGGAFVRREFKSHGPPPITAEHRADIERRVSERPIQIPSAPHHQSFVVLGCVHRPFHDKKIWSSIISYIAENRSELHGIILLGDYLDMKSLSSHDEKKLLPNGINLGMEYGDGYEGIMDLKSAFGERWGSIRKVYHYGNHENRFYKHIGQFDHSRYGTALMSPHEAMRLEENGFELQLDWENGVTMLGGLAAFHGVFTGPTAMKKHIERSNSDVIFPHTHQVGELKLGGRTAHNIGWLGDEKSQGFTYANRFAFSSWQKCWALVNLMECGRTVVNKVLCDEGGFFIGSKRY